MAAGRETLAPDMNFDPQTGVRLTPPDGRPPGRRRRFDGSTRSNDARLAACIISSASARSPAESPASIALVIARMWSRTGSKPSLMHTRAASAVTEFGPNRRSTLPSRPIAVVMRLSISRSHSGISSAAIFPAADIIIDACSAAETNASIAASR
jgi:hypothetical protein